MKAVGKLSAIEKQLSKADGGGGECVAFYKAGRGDMDGVECTLAEAFSAAMRGDLSSISFPMTKEETTEWLKHEVAKFKADAKSERELFEKLSKKHLKG